MEDGFGVSLTAAPGHPWEMRNHGECGTAQCRICMTHIYLQGGDGGGGGRWGETVGLPPGEGPAWAVSLQSLGRVRPKGSPSALRMAESLSMRQIPEDRATCPSTGQEQPMTQISGRDEGGTGRQAMVCRGLFLSFLLWPSRRT